MLTLGDFVKSNIELIGSLIFMFCYFHIWVIYEYRYKWCKRDCANIKCRHWTCRKFHLSGKELKDGIDKHAD